MGYIEQLFQTQQNPLAPTDEVRDVNQQLLSEFVSGLNSRDLIDPEEIQADLAELEQDQRSLQKAVVLNSAAYQRDYPSRDGTKARREGHKSILYVNELGAIAPAVTERWAEKPTLQGGFEFLKFMTENVDVLQAIIYTRVRQMQAFCRPYRDDDNNPLGYRFVRRDGENMTGDDIKEVRRLENIVQNSGMESATKVRRWEKRRRTFQGFIAALVADTLTADACPIELERSRTGKLLGWYNMPMETMRLAYERGYQGDEEIVAVQIDPMSLQPVLAFPGEEIVYEVRNPRSSIWMNDYGKSENEHFVKAATAYLNAFAFNSTSTDRNSMPRGFLTLHGRFGKRALREFQSKWAALLRGASRRWNVPVLTSPSRTEGGATWTPVDTQVSEMLEGKWIVFLVSIGCALHGMAPEEINFDSFSSKTSSLSGKDTSEKLQSSHDRGFIPLANWVEQTVNEHIIAEFTNKYVMTWVGLFPDDEEQKQERQKLALVVDEMRAIDGLDPMEDPDIGKAPLNPSLMSIYSQKKMMEQQAAMMGGGDAGAGGEPGPGEDDSLPGSEMPMRPGAEAGGPPGAGSVGSGGPPGAGGPPATQGPGDALQKARLVVEIRDYATEG